MDGGRGKLIKSILDLQLTALCACNMLRLLKKLALSFMQVYGDGIILLRKTVAFYGVKLMIR